ERDRSPAFAVWAVVGHTASLDKAFEVTIQDPGLTEPAAVPNRRVDLGRKGDAQLAHALIHHHVCGVAVGERDGGQVVRDLANGLVNYEAVDFGHCRRPLVNSFADELTEECQ